MQSEKILYVEDDETIGLLTKESLESSGYKVNLFVNGREGLESYQSEEYDLCILDVMLPDIDGFALAEKIRESDPAIPIIFVTARSLKEDKLKGLNKGGDDYITKPFDIEELLLKVKIFLKRRSISVEPTTEIFLVGDYIFNSEELSLHYKDEKNSLTKRESDLLLLFLQNKGKLLERAFILESLWGENDYFLGRSLDVFISRLRKYFKNEPSFVIENIHGVGFRLKDWK
jgi:DNA-binding response OmpR family regulator